MTIFIIFVTHEQYVNKALYLLISVYAFTTSIICKPMFFDLFSIL